VSDSRSVGNPSIRKRMRKLARSEWMYCTPYAISPPNLEASVRKLKRRSDIKTYAPAKDPIPM
jgi:hypothetical protein